MSGGIRGYLLSVAAVGMLLSLTQALAVKPAVRRTVSLVGSLLLILVVLSPFVKLDIEEAARSLARLRMDTEELRTGIAVGNRALTEDIIKEKCQTYIWDKAKEMGLELEVEVTVSSGTEYPYPVAVTLRGHADEKQKKRLMRYILENLGIPAERQEWI